MNKPKIIFFDVDGTLIDFERKQISEKTLDMLHRLQNNGVLICLATGRAPCSLPKIKDVRFDAYLTFNGSFCYTGEEIIFNNPLPNEDVHKIIQNAANIGRPVSIATRQRFISNGSDKDLIDYYSFAKQDLNVSSEFDKVAEQEEVYQIMLGCRKSDYPAILKDVTGARITAWWDRAADVIPANGGKGIGIRKMLEYFHFEQAEAFAFGDGNNDMEMLQAVGTGVAMENASDDLKAVADDICGHVAEDGVYHYCLKNGFI